MTDNTINGWGNVDLPQTENENIDTFPEAWKDEFEGLLYLGYLQKEITKIPFHKFVIKTLTINEKLEISLICKPHTDMIGYSRAYKAAVVAAALVSVDGRELIASSKNTNALKQKYDYVVNNWYDTVIDLIYDECESLEYKVVWVLQELGIISQITPESVFADEEENDSPKDGKQTPM